MFTARFIGDGGIAKLSSQNLLSDLQQIWGRHMTFIQAPKILKSERWLVSDHNWPIHSSNSTSLAPKMN